MKDTIIKAMIGIADLVEGLLDGKIEEQKAESRIYLETAIKFYKVGSYEKALKFYKEALAANPSLLFDRVLSKTRLEVDKRAAREFQRWLRKEGLTKLLLSYLKDFVMKH